MEGGFRLGAGGGSGGSTGGCGHGSWLTLSKGRTCSLLVGLPTAEGAELSVHPHQERLVWRDRETESSLG